MRHVGIVGSRTRSDKLSVYALVDSLDPKRDVVVSGGCRGVDKWAENRAKKNGLKTKIFLPDLTDDMNYGQMVVEYHARNRRIALLSDVIYAFVDRRRVGGTENTIKHAKELNKKVFLR